MSTLRQFLGYTKYNELFQVYVFNTSFDSVTNGGQCCRVCVPAGVTTIRFETWGGGGDGSGACCCQWGYTQGGSGSYAERTIQTAQGQCFDICAGGSGCCNNNCCGTCGFPSWVRCSSNSTMVTCGFGGCGGRALCFYKSAWSCTGFCEPAYGAENNCGFHGGDGFGKATIVGVSHTSNYCSGDKWDAVHGSPKLQPNMRKGWDHCNVQFTIAGCCRYRSVFPATGGGPASSCGGGCCWGGWGAGGIVIVTMFS